MSNKNVPPITWPFAKPTMVVAMPFAQDGTEGETLIESRRTAHRISFKVDQVRQEPKITHI